jgi:hypothetical protein
MRPGPTSRRKRKFSLLGTVAFLTFTLAMSVATRFVHYYEPYESGTKTSSYAPQSKRQDLEKDALRYAMPVLAVAFFLPPTFETLEAEPIPAPRPPLIDQNLFNRPPPSC